MRKQRARFDRDPSDPVVIARARVGDWDSNSEFFTRRAFEETKDPSDPVFHCMGWVMGHHSAFFMRRATMRKQNARFDQDPSDPVFIARGV